MLYTLWNKTVGFRSVFSSICYEQSAPVGVFTF